MRYSRIRKRRYHRRYLFILVVGVLLFVSLYVASSAAVGNFISKMLSPILTTLYGEESDSSNHMASSEDENEAEGIKLTVPRDIVENAEQADNVHKVTENLEISPQKLSSIQMGAFSSKENANILASEVQAKGGAGYIIDDQYFRVIAMAFLDEADALSVKEQLKNDQIDCQIYEITYPGVNMKITASQKNAEEIKKAFSLWEEQYKRLEDTIIEMDKELITSQTACNRIQNIQDELKQQLEKLHELSAKQDSNHILQGLIDLYHSGIDAFQKIIDENQANRVAISSKIKYTYIDMVYQFKQYMEKITKK